MERFELSKKKIDALEVCPEDYKSHEKRYFDSKCRYLMIAVTKKGKKIFRLRKKFQGRMIDIKIGDWPILSVEEARQLSWNHLNQLAKGVEPQQRQPKEWTMQDLLIWGLEQMDETKHWTKQCKARVKNGYFSKLEKQAISQLKRSQVLEWFQELTKKKSPFVANRCLTFLQSVINLAIDREVYAGSNPIMRFPKNKEQARDRFVQPEEFQHIWKAIEQEKKHNFRDFFKLALMTGVRKMNLLSMRWDDVDWTLKVWRIPMTKNGEPLRIPLVQEALTILEKRHENRINGWVFPGEHGEHVKETKRAWQRILKRANVKERLTIHDLRRTLGSWMACGGTSMAIIGKALGHKSSSATEIYARLHAEPVRNEMQKAVQSMLNTGEGFF